MPTLILISGEEDFLAERAATAEASSVLSDAVGHYRFPDDQRLYLDEALKPDVLDGHKTCFVLWGALSVPELPSYDCTVVVVSKKRIDDQRASKSMDFPKLKTFFDNNEVLRWIIKEGERSTIDLSRVAAALFVNCGNCLRKLASEIEKLATITPHGVAVSPDDVRSVLCFSSDLNPRQIVESVCEGQTSRALAFYDKLQERADETGWIIAYMHRHVLSQLRTNLLLDQGCPPDRAAQIVGVHPFVFRKGFVAQRGLWSEQSLRDSLRTFGELDALNKRGRGVTCRLEFELIRLSEEVKKCRPLQT